MSQVCPDTGNEYDSSSVDRAIHIWADRGVGFVDSIYAEDYNFRKLEDTDAQANLLRRYLMLDREDTNWYLSVAQSIINCFPGIERYLTGNVFSKNIHELPLKKSSVLNSMSVVNDGNKYSGFTSDYKSYFPIPKTYTIEWSSDDFVVIDNGVGSKTHVAVKITSSYGDPKEFLGYSLIRGSWGDALPYKGTLRYNGLWSVGSQATIDYMPVSINYETWLKEIEASISLDDLITRTGLFENYSLAKEPLEKLALLYAAIYIDYDNKIVSK